MDRTLRWRIPVIIVVVAGAALVLALKWPPPLGIDIGGGVSLVYDIRINDIPDTSEKRSGITERTANVIRKRLDPDGTKELTVRSVGEYSIEVQMPITSKAEKQDVDALVADAKRKVGQVGSLEFRLLADEALDREARASGNLPAGCRWYPVAKDAQAGLNGRATILVRTDDGFDITGADLTSAGRTTDEHGLPAVSFTFSDLAAKRFGRLTSQNLQKNLAIILDGQVQSAPVIRSRIDKHGEITGGRDGFSPQEQDALVAVLNSGSLDAALDLQSEQVVGPQMGKQNRDDAVRAIVWSAALVFIFMAVYYLTAGLIADFALVFNIVMVLAVMMLLDAPLSMPGMAGLVLTVGMAVDANVLIYERIREEKRTHLSLALAVKNGYDRAFITIFDSNLTTLFASVALIFFGTEAVKGFGITLSLGIIVSMFTQLFITRTIFNGLAGAGLIKRLPMLKLFDVPKIRFLRYRWVCLAGSLLVIALGAVAFFSRPLKDHLGTDFTGGTAISCTLTRPSKVSDVAARMADVGYPDALVQTVVRRGDPVLPFGTGKSFTITVRDTNSAHVREQVYQALAADLPQREVEYAVTPNLIPTDAGEDTGDRKTFAGGLESNVTLTPPLPRKEIETRIASAVAWSKTTKNPFEAYKIVSVEGGPTSTAATGTEALIRRFVLFSTEEDSNNVKTILDRSFVTNPFGQVMNFGPKVARRMQRDAIFALVIANILILVYVRFRFAKWMFGVGGVVALIHDALITLSFISFGYILSQSPIGKALRIEDFKIDITIVAALLTIIGFSINDTIVIFDRIRENMGGRKDRRVTSDIVNLSVNQCLPRTILTSATLLIVVLILFLFGGEGIHGFAYAMLIGCISGVYSTVYVAPPFVLGWRMPHAMAPAPAPAGGKPGKANAKAKAKEGSK